MPAGTITLTSNSTAVVGEGTAFASELNANDFIVVTLGGETYTLGVDVVVSGTSLTLLRAFTGPTTTGIAWSAVPAKTMGRITAELAEQTTYALRMNNLAKINWNAVFSESGDITITLIDGTTFTGPSWKKIIDMLEAVDMDTVQQLSNQVSTDAQQVAADKQVAADAATAATGSATAAGNSASSAASSAKASQTAKTDAETANTSAQQAKVDAITAKDAAQLAAGSVPSIDSIDAHLKGIGLAGVLQNVSDLNNITLSGSDVVHFSFLATATGSPGVAGMGTQWVNGANLVQIVSSSTGQQFRRVKSGSAEWSAWIGMGITESVLAARLGYALLSTTSNPALNSRTVFTNPFGASTPVICIPEIFHNTAGWVTTYLIYSGGQSYGTNAAYSEGEGIILRTGTAAFTSTGPYSGISKEVAANYTTASPFRIHVFKVTS